MTVPFSRFAILPAAMLAAFCPCATFADIAVAKQALADGMWQSALAEADAAAESAESDAKREEASLVAIEALAGLGDDAAIRKRLSAWNGEKGDAFRFWLARSQVRVGDFVQARKTLAEPFEDRRYILPAKCLEAFMLASSGDGDGALRLLEPPFPEDSGAAGEDAALMAGELLLSKGSTNEAVRLLSVAAASSRTGTKLRAGYLLGFTEMAEESTRTAGVARIRALLRSKPGEKASVDAAKTFARRLLDCGDASGAADEYRRYMEISPAAAADAGTLSGYAQSLQDSGRYDEAAAAYARAMQATPAADERARLAFSRGEALRSSGRFKEAAGSFGESAAFRGPDNTAALFAQADSLERSGNREAAEALYSGLAATDTPFAVKARLRLAAAAAGKGRLADAIEAYKEVLESTNALSAADATEAHLGRGRACYRDYRFEEASADFAAAAELDPQLSDGMRFLRALCLYGTGKDVDAKAEAAALMDATTNQDLRADVMMWCAKYEFNHGDFAEARTHFETFATMRPKTVEASEALLWAARCASESTDCSGAVELATRAAETVSQEDALYAEALMVQGEALMELGRYPEAYHLFDRVTSLAPGTPEAARAAALKADALYAMGAGDSARYEDAIAAYRALPEDPALSPDRRIEIEFKIGRALEKLRRRGEAADQYYRNVVLAYSAGTAKGILYGTPARTFFARAAFAVAEHCEAAGEYPSAIKVLSRVVAADVPASAEAARRMEKIKRKEGLL